MSLTQTLYSFLHYEVSLSMKKYLKSKCCLKFIQQIIKLFDRYISTVFLRMV